MWPCRSGKRLLHTALLQERCKCGGSILLAAVAVKCQIGRGISFAESYPKCTGDQIRAGIAGYAIADDFPGKEVENDAQIKPVIVELEVCNITDPCLIRMFCGKLLLQQVYIELAKDEFGISDGNALSDVLIKLSEYVHPLVLGQVYRSRAQIKMLAGKLLKNQVADDGKVSRIIDFLCSDSGSHDYTINRREAAEELELNVAKPTSTQYEIIKNLYDDFSQELGLGQIFDPKLIQGAFAVLPPGSRSLYLLPAESAAGLFSLRRQLQQGLFIVRRSVQHGVQQILQRITDLSPPQPQRHQVAALHRQVLQ